MQALALMTFNSRWECEHCSDVIEALAVYPISQMAVCHLRQEMIVDFDFLRYHLKNKVSGASLQSRAPPIKKEVCNTVHL